MRLSPPYNDQQNRISRINSTTLQGKTRRSTYHLQHPAIANRGYLYQFHIIVDSEIESLGPMHGASIALLQWWWFLLLSRRYLINDFKEQERPQCIVPLILKLYPFFFFFCSCCCCCFVGTVKWKDAINRAAARLHKRIWWERDRQCAVFYTTFASRSTIQRHSNDASLGAP